MGAEPTGDRHFVEVVDLVERDLVRMRKAGVASDVGQEGDARATEVGIDDPKSSVEEFAGGKERWGMDQEHVGRMLLVSMVDQRGG